MSILLWILFGGIVGFIADYLDSSVSLSWVERILAGVVGAVVGGTLTTLITTGKLEFTASSNFDIISIVVAVVGALIAVFAWKRLKHSS